MTSIVLYLAIVLIWGSTWLAITFQLGEVDPGVSVAHRFMLASIIIFLFLMLRGQSLRLAWARVPLVVVQGVCLFSVNYWFVYVAEQLITSGLVAVVFSNLVVFNIILGAIFLGQPITRHVVIGALCGMSGVGLLFLPELGEISLTDVALLGMLYSLIGTAIAAMGNVAAAINVRKQVPVLVSNAWGMGLGAGLLYVYSLTQGVPITIEASAEYLLSLLFLSVFGSVVAFWCYITLIGRIGTVRAGYANLLIPVVAIAASTVFENYQWTWFAAAGLGMILIGNWLVMRTSRS